MLDGCWFMEGKAPPCPHHPYCHCTLDPVPYAVVLMNAASYRDYSKFDPYLFKTDQAKSFAEMPDDLSDYRI